jgi:tetratricopeptide (TPR) repeat protein
MRGPLLEATALGYLRFYQQPEAEAALIAGANAPHPALRDAAISSLGERGLQSSASRAAALAAMGDRERGVRMGAFVSVLNNIGSTKPADVDAQRFQRGAEEFLAYAMQYQDDPPVQRDVGLIHLLRGDVPHAADALETALRLDDTLPSAKFLLALARLGEHRLDAARALLRQVPRTDPYYGPAQERLKTIDSASR